MHYTIIAIGSRGDVQPLVALARGLLDAGHTCTLLSHTVFEPFAKLWGVPFAPIHTDIENIVATEGQKFVGTRNPITMARAWLASVTPMVRTTFEDCWRVASQGTDVIVSAGIADFVGPSLAQRLGVPEVATAIVPWVSTGEHPNPFFPQMRGNAHIHRLSHFLGNQMSSLPLHRAVNAARRDLLGLPPAPLLGFRYAPALDPRRLTLLAYSPAVVAQPSDVSAARYLVTGYWFLDRPANWTPPAGLEQFLADGPPPVYIGFGSMSSRRDASALLDATLEVIRQLGVRAVLASGWGGLRPVETPNTHWIEGAPHDWLFPRVAAAVHHGGSGTTAAALRAGLPQVLVPFLLDQPFWAERVQALGVGPAAIPVRSVTAERLAVALRGALSDPEMRAKAQRLGEQIRAENGVRTAVEALNRTLGVGVPATV